MKNKIFLELIIITIALIPLNAYPEQQPSPYTENSINGVVQSKQKALLSFAQTGFIIKIPEEGQKVKQGDLIAELDDKRLSLAVMEAEAVAESKRLSVDVAAYQNDKTQRLIDKRLLSEIAIEEDTFALEQAKADLKQAEASLQSAILSIKQTKMFAPFDGYIVNVTANYGEQITVGETIAELINMQSLQLIADVPLEVSQTLKEGDSADVWLEDKQIGTATLRAIIPSLDMGIGLQKIIWDIQSDADMLMGSYVILTPTEPKE